MLQQTTVETVVPYYHRFLKRFPNVESIASASEEDLLSHWSGLGYYSRARNLHKAAKILVLQRKAGGATGGGPPPPRSEASSAGGGGSNRTRFPQEVEEWLQLPGIGRYTAGAIASIAFGERAPILDGNVIRLLSRLFLLKANPRTTQGRTLFWKKAEEVLPQTDCGDFNQGMMEMGATVCHPKKPLCALCPISSQCQARRDGTVESYPRRGKKIRYEERILSAALVRRNGSLLLVRRASRGLLPGMWEFPMVEGDPTQLRGSFPVRPTRGLKSIRHSVLNRRLKITPYLCRLLARTDFRRSLLGMGPGELRWFRSEEIRSLPTSSMNIKILDRLISSK
jgi:A/G-specific adenine glycosylase